MGRVFLYLKMRMRLVKVQECYRIIIHKQVSQKIFKWLHDHFLPSKAVISEEGMIPIKLL